MYSCQFDVFVLCPTTKPTESSAGVLSTAEVFKAECVTQQNVPSLRLSKCLDPENKYRISSWVARMRAQVFKWMWKWAILFGLNVEALGKDRKQRWRSDGRGTARVPCHGGKARRAWLRWFGHIQRGTVTIWVEERGHEVSWSKRSRDRGNCWMDGLESLQWDCEWEFLRGTDEGRKEFLTLVANIQPTSLNPHHFIYLFFYIWGQKSRQCFLHSLWFCRAGCMGLKSLCSVPVLLPAKTTSTTVALPHASTTALCRTIEIPVWSGLSVQCFILSDHSPAAQEKNKNPKGYLWVWVCSFFR